MKTPILFLLRLLYVLGCFLTGYPFIFLLLVVFPSLWDLKVKKHFQEYLDMLFVDNFYEQSNVFNFVEKYWFYRTAWDYLIGHKEYGINPNYKDPFEVKPKEKITEVKQLKNAVQEVLDKV